MDIEKAIGIMKGALGQFSEMRGVNVTVKTVREDYPAVHFSFKVPEDAQMTEKNEDAKDAEETPLEIATSVMKILRDQMDLMQDRLIGHEEDDKLLAVSGQMMEMGRVIEQIYNAIESSERLKRIPTPWGGCHG